MLTWSFCHIILNIYANIMHYWLFLSFYVFVYLFVGVVHQDRKLELKMTYLGENDGEMWFEMNQHI